MQDLSTISESSEHRSYARSICVCLGLVCGVYLLYAQTIDHEFVAFDDDRYVYAHPIMADGVSWEGVRRVWTLSASADHRWDPHGNWHPLTWLSLMIDSELYGAEKEQAGGYVLTNVALHAANAVLLFLVLRRLTGFFWLPAAVAAMFAFHPLKVEAVAWACQRKEVLSSFFGLLTILCYIRYAKSPSWARYGLVAFVLALSMASKQTLVALPVGLLLLDFWPLGRLRIGRAVKSASQPVQNDKPTFTATEPCVAETLRRLVLEKIPLLAICALAASAAFLGVYLEGGTHSAGALSVPLRVLNAATAYVVMLGKTFWPTDLAILYPHPALVYDDALQRLLLPGLAAAAFLLLVTALVLWQAQRRPYLAVGWLWYVVIFLPMSGLTQAGYHSMADRFTYIPSIGIYVMVAWGLFEFARRWQSLRYTFVTGVSLLLIGFAGMTFVQIKTWHNTATAFEHAIAVTSRNYLAHYNLGVEYSNHGFATRDREKAKPFLDQAAHHFRQACEIYPSLPRHHFNLGNVYRETGRLDEAIQKYQDTLELAPDHVNANGELGLTLAEQGKFAEATPHLREALRARQNDVKLLVRLAQSLYSQDEFGEAIALYRRAMILRPKSSQAAINLAWILATAHDARWRDGDKAIRLAERAVGMTERKDANALDTLAAAYGEAGRFSDAATAAREALALVKDPSSALAGEIRARLKLYEAEKPYHQPPVTPTKS